MTATHNVCHTHLKEMGHHPTLIGKSKHSNGLRRKTYHAHGMQCDEMAQSKNGKATCKRGRIFQYYCVKTYIKTNHHKVFM